jgi:hypothetical protein
MPKPFTVRLLALDGVWEVPGVDRERGVWAEDLTTEGDRWGGSKATFTLKRDERFVWPDLRAFNRCEVETDTVCFGGRINGTPAQSGEERQISAQVEGLQFHLDDDQYERIYLHNRVADWRDARSFLTATIDRIGMAAGQVTTDRGVLTVGWPKGAQVGTVGAFVGAVLDLGPASTAKRIVLTWEKIGAATTPGAINLLARGHDSEDAINPASVETALNSDVSGLGASGTIAFTFTTARRYISVGLTAASAPLTLGEDNLFRITSAQVFADTAYESGNTSNLKAPVVIKDAVAR